MRQELRCPAQPDKLKSFACGNYLISYLLSSISPLGVCFMQKSVVLGLSGGVDSAVAASLLLEQGFAVTGLYLDIGLGGTGAADAAAVADRLGISQSYISRLEKRIIQRLKKEILRLS